MRRALVALALTLVVALALETGVAMAAAGGGPLAEQSAKKPGKKAKKKSCKAKKKKGKAKGKAKRSGAEAAAKPKRGKAKRKAKCGKKKTAKPKSPKGKSPRDRSQSPRDRLRERLEERRREQRENHKPTAPPAPVAPADGTYLDAATGVRIAISGGGAKAQVTHTIAAEAFDCAVAGPVAVTIDSEISKSSSNPGRGYLLGDQQISGGVATVQGSIAPDGSAQLSLTAYQPYTSDPNATCSATLQVTGPLTKQ